MVTYVSTIYKLMYKGSNWSIEKIEKFGNVFIG